ncbi:thiol-disulfide isomerase/thioredoxin [Paenibacillus endophyticus]|uniref:Thiol-disulfide isomerase/thioredoxin n=1 Tax=Paenibacillus endophyticus TaxID=1294268 RepID=A0A7W5GBQ1_9BACL|nr:hypothetical protein [Paenibacillus endophyticus]MBB3154060.1 thiol-disulfide isomerase/thioredoxin [Paenibacillus endophyticus]
MVKIGEKTTKNTRDTGITVGTQLPQHELTIPVFQTEGKTALLFISLHCMHCVDLLPYIKKIQNNYPFTFFLYSNGDKDDHAEMVEYFGWDFSVITASVEKMETIFHVAALPFGILCDENKRVIEKSVVYNDAGFDFLFQSTSLQDGG